MKRYLTICLLGIFLITPLFRFNAKAYGTDEKAKRQFSNLVLFISFSDTAAEYWDDKGAQIDGVYNTTGRDSLLSVKDYFDIASGGSFVLNIIFPQFSESVENAPAILPITLGHPMSYYGTTDGDYALVKDSLDKLNSDSSLLSKIAVLDGDNDGYVDNITFLVAGKESNRASALYPHKANGAYYNISVIDKRLNAYNVINYESLSSANGGAGVVAHELMHVLGPLDTYRLCGENSESCGTGPVGCWDIMAQTSSFVQYPLACTRKELGWICVKEGLSSGNYTLTSPQKDSNGYAMILKTEYSDSEYFVIEYRKKGSFYNEAREDKIDAKIGGSGLIIYRVNTAASPASNLSQDYIYVFREGESETNATTAKAMNAFLSEESGRTAYGRAEESATTIDGAITYTDGTNSGIVISNVGRADGDTISFDVTYSLDMTGKCWSTEMYHLVDMDYNSGAGLNAGFLKGKLYGSNMKIVPYQDKLYGICSNNKGKAELLRLENGQWVSVKVLTIVDSYNVDMSVGEDGLLYMVAGFGDYSSCAVYSMDSSEKITDITSSFPVVGKSVACPKIAGSSSGIVITYRDYLDHDKIYSFVKTGSVWKQLNNSEEIHGNYFDLCTDGATVYLVTGCGNGNYVYRYNEKQGTQFVKNGTAYTENEATVSEVFVDENHTVYVAYFDSLQKCILVKAYQENGWKQLGMKVYNQLVSNINAFASGDDIYVAYTGSEEQGIKSHKILNPVSDNNSTTETEPDKETDTADKVSIKNNSTTNMESVKEEILSDLKSGTKITDIKSSAIYKITGSNTVEYVSPGKNQKPETIIIPSHIMIQNHMYQVTSIGAKACYRCKALKKLVIPSTIRKIGNKAFFGCKNLKRIIIKTKKLSKKNYGKKVFQGIHKKAIIKVPKEKKKLYKKLIKEGVIR